MRLGKKDKEAKRWPGWDQFQLQLLHRMQKSSLWAEEQKGHESPLILPELILKSLKILPFKLAQMVWQETPQVDYT